MTCDRAMDIIMDEDGGHRFPFIEHVHARLHILRCRSCSHEARRLGKALDLMRTDFLPIAPDLRDVVMTAIRRELNSEGMHAAEGGAEEVMPLRHWVVVGLVIFASLAVSPLGAAFDRLVRSLGSDLLFPISLTLGVVLTAYCALFIGSHLDELSERFGITRES